MADKFVCFLSLNRQKTISYLQILKNFLSFQSVVSQVVQEDGTAKLNQSFFPKFNVDNSEVQNQNLLKIWKSKREVIKILI